MEKNRLVCKVGDSHNKNLVRIMLTEKGEQAYNGSLKRNSVDQIVSSLSEEDLKHLRSYLETLKKAARQRTGSGTAAPKRFRGRKVRRTQTGLRLRAA